MDLISRSELKEAIRKRLGISSLNYLTAQEKVIVEEIENAPTVETDIETVGKDAYKQGYIDGWKERYGEPNERPQGEWLFTEIDENYHVYGQCSVCKERNRIGKACRSCGAEMKGGAE